MVNTVQKVHGSFDGALFYQEGEMQFLVGKKVLGIFF